jgi:calcineurin-like phosphoesterase family protein
MHTAPIKRILPQLNGHKILIVGNHDLCYSYFIKTRGQKFVDKMTKDYKEAGFEMICFGSLRILHPSYEIRLCHFPTKNAEDKYHNDKHDAARPVDNGMLNICGHVHQNWLKRGNNINVGVDVWDFTPVPLDEILKIWQFMGDIDAPHPFRIAFWKLYHTLLWKISNLFPKKNK